MSKEKYTEDQIAVEAAEFLQEFYAPAADYHDATDFLTTGDAIAMVRDIRPALEIDSDLLYDALKDAGFKYKYIDKGCARWLFRKKTNV
jgi:hypothetical protein